MYGTRFNKKFETVRLIESKEYIPVSFWLISEAYEFVQNRRNIQITFSIDNTILELV